MRARSGLYWYHPHPHGLTAGQTYRGLFGLIAVDDADDRALRAALDLVRGRTEIPLVLQDRRPGAGYAPDAGDMHHGFLGDIAHRQWHAAVRISTSRTRAIGSGSSTPRTREPTGWDSRDAAGRPFPFTLLGTDGGLLAAPARCGEVLSLAGGARSTCCSISPIRASARRSYSKSRAFDPMHSRLRAGAGAPAATRRAFARARTPRARRHGPARPLPRPGPRARRGGS